VLSVFVQRKFLFKYRFYSWFLFIFSDNWLRIQKSYILFKLQTKYEKGKITVHKKYLIFLHIRRDIFRNCFAWVHFTVQYSPHKRRTENRKEAIKRNACESPKTPININIIRNHSLFIETSSQNMQIIMNIWVAMCGQPF
jgi:hypothetical protein